MILKDITAVLFLDSPYIFKPSILRSSEVAYLSNESSYLAIVSYPISLMYSTAFPRPIPPAIFGVPASNLCGNPAYVVFSKVT